MTVASKGSSMSMLDDQLTIADSAIVLLFNDELRRHGCSRIPMLLG